MPHKDAQRIRLGSVQLPSGVLVIIDMGHLGLWSGEAEPQPSQVLLDQAAEQSAGVVTAARDLRITGADAEAAARALDLQSQTFIYDIPEPEWVAQQLSEVVARCRLDARLHLEPRRVPHAERARRAAAGGGADFLVWGVWASAIGGLPTDRPLPVWGQLADYGPRVGRRWQSVVVEVGRQPAATSHTVGYVGVDWARLILADVASLNAWAHEQSLDGLADLVFWGADGAECCARFGGQHLGEEGFGFRDRPLEQARALGLRIEDWIAQHGKRLVLDFRPHSHHWQLMRAVRAHPHATGELELGGGRALGLMTGWGDGVFEAFAERAADGSLTAVRLLLGDAERAAQLERLAGE